MTQAKREADNSRYKEEGVVFETVEVVAEFGNHVGMEGDEKEEINGKHQAWKPVRLFHPCS